MGVIRCNRNGCERIGCDRHSPEYGYICGECFEELVSMGPTANIEAFMDSPKPATREDEARARYEAAFPRTDYD